MRRRPHVRPAPLPQAAAGAAVLLCGYLLAFWKMGGVVPGIPAGHTMGMLEAGGLAGAAGDQCGKLLLLLHVGRQQLCAAHPMA